MSLKPPVAVLKFLFYPYFDLTVPREQMQNILILRRMQMQSPFNWNLKIFDPCLHGIGYVLLIESVFLFNE